MIGEPASKRLRTNRLGCGLQISQFLESGEAFGAFRGTELVGVRLTVPPRLWPLPLSPFGQRLRVALLQGFRVSGRWAQVGDALQARHPLGGHAYLAMLGVHPDAQRSGVGRTLLTDWLTLVDAEGSWAWLETDREACLAFYGSAGFEVKERLELLGAPVHLMERPGRG